MSDKKIYVQLIAGISLLVVSIILMVWRSVARMLIGLFTDQVAPHNAFIIIGLCVMFVAGLGLIIVAIKDIKKLSKSEIA